MEAYPTLVRKRIIELLAEQKSTKGDRHTVRRQPLGHTPGQAAAAGTRHTRSAAAPGRPQAQATPDLAQQIASHVAAHADATREEVKRSLGLDVSAQTVGEWLRKLGLVLKKKLLHAAELPGEENVQMILNQLDELGSDEAVVDASRGRLGLARLGSSCACHRGQ